MEIEKEKEENSSIVSWEDRMFLKERLVNSADWGAELDEGRNVHRI